MKYGQMKYGQPTYQSVVDLLSIALVDQVELIAQEHSTSYLLFWNGHRIELRYEDLVSDSEEIIRSAIQLKDFIENKPSVVWC